MDTLQRVYELINERGISIYRLAQMSGISYSTIRTSEKRNGQLSIDVLERICKALNISLAEFFADGKELVALRALYSVHDRGVLNAGNKQSESICKSIGNV